MSHRVAFQAPNNNDLSNDDRASNVDSAPVIHLAESKGSERKRIIWAILLGFTGYYFLRSNMMVSLPLLLASLPGVDRAEFGTIISFGYLFYALGKFASGPIIDAFGGCRMFLGGYVASMVMVLAFTLVSPNQDSNHQVLLFGIFWSLNRLSQSAGWGSVVQIINNWFPSSMHGRVFGIASLSYGIGDVCVRVSLGLLLIQFSPEHLTVVTAGIAWRKLYYSSLVIALLLLVPTALWLKNAPEEQEPTPTTPDIDNAEDVTDQASLYHKELKRDTNRRAKTLTNDTFVLTVSRLVKMPKFWLLFLTAPCLALIRETFISWTAMYFTDVMQLTASNAAVISMLFPLFGTLSTVLGGWAMDNIRIERRGLISVVCLACLSVTLMLSSFMSDQLEEIFGQHHVAGPTAVWVAACMLSLIALCILAPFSFVDGVLVTHLVGKSGAGVAVGIISSCGYTGAILAGHTMGSVADQEGWPHVLFLLGVVSIIALVLSIGYYVADLADLKSHRSSTTRSRPEYDYDEIDENVLSTFSSNESIDQ